MFYKIFLALSNKTHSFNFVAKYKDFVIISYNY